LRISTEGDLMAAEGDFMRLSHRDLTALMAALPKLYARASLEEIPRKLLQVVSALVVCFAATYDEWDVDRDGRVHSYRVVEEPVVPEIHAILPRLPALIHEHPLFPALQRQVTQPLKISDFATDRQFLRSRIYNEFYRLVDVQHQMAWFLPGHESPHICLVLNRQRQDFSERDRQILMLLSPHLRQVHSNAMALAKATTPTMPLRDGASEFDWEVVTVSENGQPQSLSQRAAEWLRKYFDTGRFESWPGALRKWIQQQTWATKLDEALFSRRPPLILERGASRLSLTFLPGRDGAGMLLLNKTQTTTWPAGLLQSLPLTSRERDVFRWICEGKTNPEIAGILGISPRTVDKHVEHVLEKLNLENRFQAQRLGWELRTASPAGLPAQRPG
jgi:DNA-binding CsgD family transcriptional regulator